MANQANDDVLAAQPQGIGERMFNAVQQLQMRDVRQRIALFQDFGHAIQQQHLDQVADATGTVIC